MIELKILPKFYDDIIYKDKRFEVRNIIDRTFKLGDLILLREYYKGEYTDRECIIKIIYILTIGLVMLWNKQNRLGRISTIMN